MGRWRVKLDDDTSYEVTTPAHESDQPLKSNRLETIDLDEDYEVKYPRGYRPDPEDLRRDIPVGTCDRMCPLIEISEREKNKRLNKYEIEEGSNPPRADFNLVIKEYTRSCVGRELQGSDVLRPWSVLQRTFYHLLLDIAIKDDDWMQICDFVYDRLKCIRQDMFIQRINGSRYIEVLEGSIRFLVYSLYRLTCTLRDTKESNRVRTRLVTPTGPVKGLNSYELNVVREIKLTTNTLRECLYLLILQYEEYVPDSLNRPIFEALNLIINNTFLRNHRSIQSAYIRNENLREKDPTFKLIYKMFMDHSAGLHLTALKHVPELSDPLLIIAYAPVLVSLQVYLTFLLRKAYKSSTSSLQHLADMLCPVWLGKDQGMRINFARFMAIQNDIYDNHHDIVDYRLCAVNPNEFQMTRSAETDSDTRFYALQMITGRNWPFFQNTFNHWCVDYILNPTASRQN